MKLTEFDSLNECLDFLDEHEIIHNVGGEPPGYTIDKKHGYRVKYLELEDSDPRIDEFWPGTGLSIISCPSNRFKDTKSVVSLTAMGSVGEDPNTVRYALDNNSMVDRIAIFDGLFQIICQYGNLKDTFSTFGFVIISDMMYEHRKNALSVLMSIMDEPIDMDT